MYESVRPETVYSERRFQSNRVGIERCESALHHQGVVELDDASIPLETVSESHGGIESIQSGPQLHAFRHFAFRAKPDGLAVKSGIGREDHILELIIHDLRGEDPGALKQGLVPLACNHQSFREKIMSTIKPVKDSADQPILRKSVFFDVGGDGSIE